MTTEAELGALIAERDAARAELLRLKVGAAKGLSAEQAARLRGDDEETMTADADALLAAFGAAPPAPRLTANGGEPGAASGTLRGAERYRATHGVNPDGSRREGATNPFSAGFTGTENGR
jgi:hypothetical protein